MTAPEVYRPWLHCWAFLTATAVFPLVALGGLVTSMRVGMVDDQSIRVPWYMFTLAWGDTADAHGIGYLVEHGHRQLGWIVGVLTIILTGWLWVGVQRRWLKVVGVVALLGVALQGVLGILRVELNRAGLGLEFAMVHGVTGQLVFALLASIALFTSQSWIEGPVVMVEYGARFRKMCRLTALLIVLQLVIGVCVRQQGGSWVGALGLHVFVAMAILAHAVMLVIRVRREGMRSVGLVRHPTLILGSLIGLQVALGLGAWWFGAGAGAMDHQSRIPNERVAMATAHVGIGALALALVVILMLRAYRHLRVETTAVPVGATEGVA